MHDTTLQVEVHDTTFTVVVTDVALDVRHGRLERSLSDIALLLASVGGVVTSGLRMHLTEHFGAGQMPLAKCEFCKLQGKILAAEGRRRLSEREQRDRAKPAQVTVLRAGLSGAGLERALRSADLREAERLRRLPRLNGAGRNRSGDTEGVWF